ncbi:MAG: tetratricopeptide repeat protein, partial [Planctomycetota bacterium]
MRLDTFKAYKKAHDDFEAAAKKMDDAPLPVALQIQAAAAVAYRFSPNRSMRSTARDLLAGLKKDTSEPLSDLKKAKGLVALAFARIPEATQELKAISDQEPGDALAAVYLGWTQLAKDKLKAASSSFSRALAKDPKHAAAMFGMAQVHHRMKKPKAALSWVNKTLAASARHPGALLLKSSIFREANKIKQAQKTLKLAMTAKSLSSRGELSQIQSSLGDLALLDGRTDDARKLFQKALKINPRGIDALFGLGQTFHSARQLKRAMKIYEKAQLISPNNIQVAIMVARTQIDLGKPLRAQKTLQSIKKAAPNTPEIFFLLGQVEVSVNNTASAEKNFLAAIKKKPSYFPPYLHLSRLYLGQDKLDEALAILNKADSQFLGSPLVRNAEGEVYLATDKLDIAQTKFEEALRLDDTLNTALFNLARCLQKQGKLEEAKTQYLALQQKDKSFPRLSEHLAALLIKLEQYTAAAEAYDQALMIDNPEVALRMSATRGYLLAGQNKKALKQTEEILKADPTIAHARAMRAEAFLAMGNFSEAGVEISQAISREKKAEYYVTRGQIQEKKQRRGDAIASYSQVLKMDPSRMDIRYRRAVLLIKSEAYKDALKDLKPVIKNNPEMAEAYVYLGDIYAELSQESKALKVYRTALSKDHMQARAHFRMGQLLFDKRNIAAA